MLSTLQLDWKSFSGGGLTSWLFDMCAPAAGIGIALRNSAPKSC